MADKHLAKGASIELDISSTFTPVPSCKKITPPDDGPEMWDATTLDDSDKVMKPTGLTDDPGKVTAQVLFDSNDPVHSALMTAKGARTLKNFKIKGPTTDLYIYTFSGYVTKFTPTSEVGKGNEANLELTLAAPATYAAAS